MKTKLKKRSKSQRSEPPKTERVVRQNEIIHSDRIELIAAATRVAGMLISKQITPLIHSDYPVDAPALDASERQAHEAALAFLTRQFEQGYSLSEPIEKMVEVHYGSKRRGF